MVRSVALNLATLVVAAAFLAWPVGASAQVDPYADLTIEEAEELLDIIAVADAARDAGRWAAALGGYEEFLLRVDDPFIRLEAAGCLEQLGRYEEADQTYGVVLESGDAEAADRAVGARDALRDAHPQQVTFLVDPPTASIVVTAAHGATWQTSSGEPLTLRAGTYDVRLEADGYIPADRELTVTLDGPHDRGLTLEPVPPPEPVVVAEPEPAPEPEPEPAPVAAPAPTDSMSGTRAGPAVAMAIFSAGAFAVSGYYFHRANELSDEFDSYFATTPEEQRSLAQLRGIGQDGQQAERIAWGTVSTGAGLAVLSVITGVVMNRNARQGDEAHNRRGATAAVGATPRRVSLTVRW